jgi:hypothetical protein
MQNSNNQEIVSPVFQNILCLLLVKLAWLEVKHSLHILLYKIKIYFIIGRLEGRSKFSHNIRTYSRFILKN